MNATDILTLARAGYNSAQIALLAQAENIPAPAPAPAPVPAPAPAPAPAPVPVPAPAPAPAPVPAPVPAPAPAPAPVYVSTDPLMEQIQQLTNMVQAQAISHSEMPQAQQTADQILATIIDPQIYTRGGKK